jgi:hypothetical protein
MAFHGIYSQHVTSQLQKLATGNKWALVSHGTLNPEKKFKIPKGRVVIFVTPEFGFLSKKFAINTLAGKGFFNNEQELQKFLTFQYPEKHYQLKTGNATLYVRMHGEGEEISDLDLNFIDKDVQQYMGVWKIPFTPTSMPFIPRATTSTLKEILSIEPGVFFVFTCRASLCLNLKRILPMTGGGYIEASTNRFPEQENTSRIGGFTDLSRALEDIQRSIDKLENSGTKAKQQKRLRVLGKQIRKARTVTGVKKLTDKMAREALKLLE